MKSIFAVAALGGTIVFSANGETIPLAPNLQHLANGLNIYRYFPLGTGMVSSSRSDVNRRMLINGAGQQIFDFNYDESNLDYINGESIGGSKDDTYTAPKGMVTPSIACSLDVSTTTISSNEQFDESIGAKVTLSGGVKTYGAKFSATTEYKSMTSEKNTEDRSIAFSSVTCTKYEATNQLSADSFTDEFVSRVVDLTQTNLAQFVEDYGTHYVKGTIFGGEFTSKVAVKKTDRQVIANVDQSYSATASASYLAATVGASAEVSANTKTFQELGITDTQQKQLVIGGTVRTNEDGIFDLTEWVNSGLTPANSQPLPMAGNPMRVALISDLLTEHYFKDVLSNEEITARRDMLQSYLTGATGYCVEQGLGCQYPVASSCAVLSTDELTFSATGFFGRFLQLMDNMCYQRGLQPTYSDYSCPMPAVAAQACTMGRSLAMTWLRYKEYAAYVINVPAQGGVMRYGMGEYWTTLELSGTQTLKLWNNNTLCTEGDFENGVAIKELVNRAYKMEPTCFYADNLEEEDAVLSSYCRSMDLLPTNVASNRVCWDENENQEACKGMGHEVTDPTKCCGGFAETMYNGKFQCLGDNNIPYSTNYNAYSPRRNATVDGYAMFFKDEYATPRTVMVKNGDTVPLCVEDYFGVGGSGNGIQKYTGLCTFIPYLK